MRWRTGSMAGFCWASFRARIRLTSRISAAESTAGRLAGWLNGMQNSSQMASAARRPSAQAAMMLSGLMTTSPPA